MVIKFFFFFFFKQKTAYEIRKGDWSSDVCSSDLGGEAFQGTGDAAEFRPVGERLKRYAASLSQPFCGPRGDAEAAAWFGEGASHVRSVAHMALRDKECFGMLALGSEDVLRFYPEMGTLYLKRMGELAGAALLRFL